MFFIPQRFKGKKILVIHFRAGKTDGVSLEIDAWQEIWNRMGFTVEICAGPVSEGSKYVIPDLEQQLNPIVFQLDEEAFGGFKKLKNSDEFRKEFLRLQRRLQIAFDDVLKKSKQDYIVVSNIFSVGENLPAAAALYNILEKYKIPTICVHHDFYWENSRYSLPSSDFVAAVLDKYYPPHFNFMRHACINSIAQSELKERKGINSVLMPDTIDFTDHAGEKKKGCYETLKHAGLTENDLVVLQATRVVRRKNIELSIDFVKSLKRKVGILGKKRIVLVMAGYAEKRDGWYLDKLTNYARENGVDTIHLNGIYGDGCKLIDVYPFADLVIYPSEYEGFGNQFLEAVYYKKPIVMFEYPVYVKDIKPLGFEIISLGNKISYSRLSGFAEVPTGVIGEAVERSVSWLMNEKERNKITEKNFEIAKINYSFEMTTKRWEKLFGFNY